MVRHFVLGLLAAAAIAPAAFAQPGATYRRYRGTTNHHYYPPRRPPIARATGPAVTAGTFQRPYPYHLDYYKHRWGGSYEPYFGNLYGPPNVVLSPYGGGYGGYGIPYAAPIAPQPQTASPAALVCPHCHQPIYFATPQLPPNESPRAN